MAKAATRKKRKQTVRKGKNKKRRRHTVRKGGGGTGKGFLASIRKIFRNNTPGDPTATTKTSSTVTDKHEPLLRWSREFYRLNTDKKTEDITDDDIKSVIQTIILPFLNTDGKNIFKISNTPELGTYIHNIIRFKQMNMPKKRSMFGYDFKQKFIDYIDDSNNDNRQYIIDNFKDDKYIGPDNIAKFNEEWIKNGLTRRNENNNKNA